MIDSISQLYNFMRRARRFVEDMFDAGLLQCQMEVMTTGCHSSFGGADADEEHLDLLGESHRMIDFLGHQPKKIRTDVARWMARAHGERWASGETVRHDRSANQERDKFFHRL